MKSPENDYQVVKKANGEDDGAPIGLIELLQFNDEDLSFKVLPRKLSPYDIYTFYILKKLEDNEKKEYFGPFDLVITCHNFKNYERVFEQYNTFHTFQLTEFDSQQVIPRPENEDVWFIFTIQLSEEIETTC